MTSNDLIVFLLFQLFVILPLHAVMWADTKASTRRVETLMKYLLRYMMSRGGRQ